MVRFANTTRHFLPSFPTPPHVYHASTYGSSGPIGNLSAHIQARLLIRLAPLPIEYGPLRSWLLCNRALVKFWDHELQTWCDNLDQLVGHETEIIPARYNFVLSQAQPLFGPKVGWIIPGPTGYGVHQLYVKGLGTFSSTKLLSAQVGGCPPPFPVSLPNSLVTPHKVIMPLTSSPLKMDKKMNKRHVYTH